MNVVAYLKDWAGERLVRRTPGLYARLSEIVRRSEAMSLEERRALRDRLTRRLLRRASGTPYGRDAGSKGDYERWPLLEKETLRRHPAICSARTLIPPHAASTGGTTGVPITLSRSLESVVLEQAVLDRLVRRHADLDLDRARVAILRGDVFKSPDDMREPHWLLRPGGRRLVCSSFHLNAATIAGYVEAMRRFAPQVLWVYPSALEAFLRLGSGLLAARGLAGLKLVLSSSEVLDAAVSADVSSMLGVPVLDYYGQSERVCASWSIRPGEHYFLPAYGRVELLHAYDDGASSLYEIVGSSYWNAAQPLVRFRTGDLARLRGGMGADELEAVTLGLLPFEGIEGRRSEYILSPDGGRLIGMNHIPRDVPGIAQMQIVQKSLRDVEIMVVPLEDFGDASIGAILANARKKIPSSMEIAIRPVDSVTRTRSGKAPLVMRLVD